MSFVGNSDKDLTIKIGEKAPKLDYEMAGVSGKTFTLNSIVEEKGICVIFSCNTCPFVVGRGEDNEGWEGRYNGLAAWSNKNNVGIVFVNSNEAKRKGDDSLEAMKKHAKENNYKFKYVEDIDSKLANAFGARTTPHVFLFNKSFQLVYEGAIDDNIASSKKVEQQYLKNAISSLNEGKTIDPSTTKALGCSIKRK